MRDITYIIKRIIIGVGIALVLGYIRGGLIGNVYALSPTTITAYDTTNSNCTTTCNDSFCNFYFSPSCKIDRISVRNNSYSLIDTGRYELFTSIVIGQELQTLNIRSDKYLGNYQSTQWNNLTQTWNNIDNITLGNNGFYNVEWGSAYTFTSSFNSGGVTFDFYFASRQDINYVRVKRFELVNTGSTTTDAINNNTNQIINSQNNNTQEIINNNNTNTQNIINNQNNNTQSIINNQNSNTDKEIDSERVCKLIDSSYGITTNSALNSSGSIVGGSSFTTTDYIYIKGSLLKIANPVTYSTTANTCFYTSTKALISCINNQTISSSSEVSYPNNAYYFRTSINTNNNRPTFELCLTGNQAIADTNKAINDSINNDDVTGSTSEGNSFFNNFTVNSHGLSGIITAPFRLLNSFTTATCNPLTFILPFTHDTVTLQCMRPILENYFGVFFSLWQLITTGLISYNVIINLYSKVRNLENPNNDRIEVLNL